MGGGWRWGSTSKKPRRGWGFLQGQRIHFRCMMGDAPRWGSAGISRLYSTSKPAATDPDVVCICTAGPADSAATSDAMKD